MNLGINLALGTRTSRPAPLVLDNLPAAAAYSTRRLRTGHTRPAMRVRRSSDNLESDIGFAADGWLDTPALLAFVGSGNGFVVRWYDQSGMSNDFVQLTASNQPVIVLAGTLVTLNGRPSIISQTAAQWMQCTTGTLLGRDGQVLPENYVSAVARLDASMGHAIISNDSPGLFGHGVGNATGGAFFALFDRGFFTGAADSYPFSTLAIVTTQWSTTAGNRARVNGVSVWSGGNDTGDGGSPTVTLFCFQPNVRGSSGAVYISEIVIAKSAISAGDSQTLERNQGAAFGVSVA